jgi:hypothetical protein
VDAIQMPQVNAVERGEIDMDAGRKGHIHTARSESAGSVHDLNRVASRPLVQILANGEEDP